MAKIADNKIYDLFEAFVEGFIKNKTFCLLNAEECCKYTKEDVCKSLEEVKNTFINNPIYDDGETEEKRKFNEKLECQFEDREIDKICFSHIHWLWAFAASDMTAEVKNSFQFKSLEVFTISENFKLEDKIGIGSARPRLQKYEEIVFLLKAVASVWDANGLNTEMIKEKLRDYCNSENEKDRLPIKNALLHLCDPDKYENIFSNSVKESIKKSLGWLDKERTGDREDCLLAIRNVLINEYHLPNTFSFYDTGIRELWQIDDTKVDNLTDTQLLEYKKAMVLYGPPGTGKTYSALKLAKIHVLREMVKHIRSNNATENIKNDFSILLKKPKGKDEKDRQQKVLNKYVGRLQLHINYNYDDFVAGMTIMNDGVQVNHGYIYTAIDNAKKLNGLPYIIILDEINRTDISRVFGEVFSAMEYRGEDVALSIKGAMPLNIPDNLYFIGTMNEIDFSLERIDFALRRRFIWKRRGFDIAALKEIIADKKYGDYCKECANLNKEICAEPDLGPDYEIGHSFFGEIKKIDNQLDNIRKSKNILWQISIEPILQAYCGAMDDNKKANIIGKCKNAFGLTKPTSDGEG